MFLVLSYKIQNIEYTLHQTVLIAHPYRKILSNEGNQVQPFISVPLILSSITMKTSNIIFTIIIIIVTIIIVIVTIIIIIV